MTLACEKPRASPGEEPPKVDLTWTIGRTLTVEDVVKHHEALHGQRVRVKGWIGECAAYSCSLQAHEAGPPYVQLGSSSNFDRAVARLDGQLTQVEVEGRIDRTCFDHNGEQRGEPKVICFDRANQLENPRLIRALNN